MTVLTAFFVGMKVIIWSQQSVQQLDKQQMVRLEFDWLPITLVRTDSKTVCGFNIVETLLALTFFQTPFSLLSYNNFTLFMV